MVFSVPDMRLEEEAGVEEAVLDVTEVVVEVVEELEVVEVPVVCEVDVVLGVLVTVVEAEVEVEVEVVELLEVLWPFIVRVTFSIAPRLTKPIPVEAVPLII